MLLLVLRSVQPSKNTSGRGEEAVAATWALGTAAAATAEPARIDPAALSARIAGMMMDRLIRMISPEYLRSSAACRSPRWLARHIGVFRSYCRPAALICISISSYFHLFQGPIFGYILLRYLPEISMPSGRKVLAAHAAQESAQFALHDEDITMTSVRQCRLNAELVSEKQPLVR